MAEIKHKSKQSKPRKTSCFLGCVVFPSWKLVRQRESPEAVRSGDDPKKTRSWSILCFKKSATKTVPVDTTTVSDQKPVLDNNNIHSSKLILKSKLWSKSKTTDNLRHKRKVSSKPPSEIEVVVAADPYQITNNKKPLEVCKFVNLRDQRTPKKFKN